MIVITGATSHIGNVLAATLVERGEEVRALVHPSADVWSLRGMPGDVILGDIGDVAATAQAFKGAEMVYHLEELNPAGRRVKAEKLRQVNVVGTENVLEACRKAWVRRLVHVGSIFSFARPPQGAAVDEGSPIDPESAGSEFARSKAEATLKALDAAKQGLDVVVVCPTNVIGPHDYEQSPISKLLADLAWGRFESTSSDDYNFVDVRDVAEGIIKAGAVGNRGETYILSGERATLAELGKMFQALMQAESAQTAGSSWLMQVEMYLAQRYYRMRRGSSRYTGDYLETLLSDYQVNDEKTRRDLSYTSRPLKQTAVDTMHWMRSNNML